MFRGGQCGSKPPYQGPLKNYTSHVHTLLYRIMVSYVGLLYYYKMRQLSVMHTSNRFMKQCFGCFIYQSTVFILPGHLVRRTQFFRVKKIIFKHCIAMCHYLVRKSVLRAKKIVSNIFCCHLSIPRLKINCFIKNVRVFSYGKISILFSAVVCIQ